MAVNSCPRIETQFVGCKPEGRLIIDIGAVSEVGAAARAVGAEQVLLVCDHFLRKNGVAERAVHSLNGKGISCVVFDGILGEPTEETVRSALHGAQGCNAVVGLGGGSAMDTAKLAAVCLAENVDPDHVLQLDASKVRALPLVLLPTTAGTGSEVSPYAVFTLHGQKKFLTSSVLYPTIALVDPALMETLPPEPTAYTALDALTHGIEGCCGKTNPITMAFASECTRRIFRSLPIAMKDGSRLDARYDLSCAAVMGMMAYTQGGGLYAHSMSYLLPMLPHGKGCALALPATLELNRPAISEVLEMLDRAIGCEPGQFLTKLRELIRFCGLPGTLKEVGVEAEKLEEIVQGLLTRYPRKNNPVSLTPDLAHSLIETMYE